MTAILDTFFIDWINFWMFLALDCKSHKGYLYNLYNRVKHSSKQNYT